MRGAAAPRREINATGRLSASVEVLLCVRACGRLSTPVEELMPPAPVEERDHSLPSRYPRPFVSDARSPKDTGG